MNIDSKLKSIVDGALREAEKEAKRVVVVKSLEANEMYISHIAMQVEFYKMLTGMDVQVAITPVASDGGVVPPVGETVCNGDWMDEWMAIGSMLVADVDENPTVATFFGKPKDQ